MIAWINGVMVQGSPEEIERYRTITAEKITTTNVDSVPKHVRDYGKYNIVYKYTGENAFKAWF